MGDDSFAIGDRVILQNLKNAAHLNGRHGAIAGPTTSKGRFPVDLDLLDASSPRMAAKASNLRHEAPLPDDIKRADASDGILAEEYGRPLSYVFDAMRFIVGAYIQSDENIKSFEDIEKLRSGAGHKGLLQLNQMMATGWSLWEHPGGFRTPNNQGVYALLEDWVKNQMMENNENNRGLNLTPQEQDLMDTLLDAIDNPAAIKGWNVRVYGDFWIVGIEDDGTLLVPDLHRHMVYKVLGVRNAIFKMLPSDRPCKMRITMIPWFGRLVYDGVISPAGAGGLPEFASESSARKLKRSVEKAKAEGRVIDRLRQLEVPGGSLEGLPTQGAKKGSEPKQQDPETSEERRLVGKLNDLPPLPTNQVGMWVFRRFGYTEHENPEHRIVVLAGGGSVVTMFQCEKLEPTSAEILRAAINAGREQGMRPCCICIDDVDCFERVKYLLKDMRGTDVEYYMPPTPEETAACVAMGDYS